MDGRYRVFFDNRPDCPDSELLRHRFNETADSLIVVYQFPASKNLILRIQDVISPDQPMHGEIVVSIQHVPRNGCSELEHTTLSLGFFSHARNYRIRAANFDTIMLSGADLREITTKFTGAPVDQSILCGCVCRLTFEGLDLERRQRFVHRMYCQIFKPEA
jgi:hypothetical protein